MIARVQFENEKGGVRLDAALLAHFPSATRAFVREAIQSGNVLVNGRPGTKGMRLGGRETIHVREMLEAADNLVSPAGACPEPIYADDTILAFDKPAGMPVQPLTCREKGTLMNAVAARYPECRPIGDRPLLAGALHRIDADTSGLVLVARTPDAFDALRVQFTNQTVEKTYLALVEGLVTEGARLENDLVHDPTLPFCRMVDAHRNRLTRAQVATLRPFHAVTEYEPAGTTCVGCETRTLLRVTIFTGVTHQIRAQLALNGIHIVNDRLYGAFAVEGQRGHCLHAFAASFLHPTGHMPIYIETPAPKWANL